MIQRGFAPILIILLVVVILAGSGFFVYQTKFSNSPSPLSSNNPSEKACTLEAKICPDGTSVGRTGPNCEFSTCPQSESTASANTSNWKAYEGQNINLSFMYPPNCNPKEGLYNISLSCADNNLYIDITHEPNDNNESLEGYIKRMEESYPQMINTRNLTIDGISTKAWRSQGQLVNNDFYHLIYKSERVDIVKNPIEPTEPKLFDQILSTFKFTP